MKKFASAVLLLAVSASSFAVSYDRIALPERFGNTFISDSADILSADNERRLDADLISYYEATGTQIAVFTTQDTNGSPTPKDFANKLFERLALGEKDVDNGLLILLSIDDRRVEFETGYGLEGLLPDVTQYRIQQRLMIPAFKKGDYEQGLLDGTYATISVLDAAAILQGKTSTEKQVLAGDNPPTSKDMDALSKSATAAIEETPKTLTTTELLRNLMRLSFFLGLGFLILGIYKLWSARPREDELDSKSEKLVTLKPIENAPRPPRPPAIITRCTYCDSNILETDKITDLKINMKALHFSFYERKISEVGMATIDIYSCSVCSFINKVYHTGKPIIHCHACSSKSVYCLSSHSNNLSNHLNVYRDKLARTIPLQSIRFKSVSSKWRENSSILLIINHCFICNDMTQNIGEVAIPHAPSKPRPQTPRKVAHVESPPKPKGAVSSSARPSSRPSITLGSSASSHSASIARKRSGGSSSVPKSKRAPTRKSGGRSGGGGAGSSW